MDKAQFYIIDRNLDFNEVKVDSHGIEQTIFLEKFPIDIDRNFELNLDNGKVEIKFNICQSLSLDVGKEVLTSGRGFVKVENLTEDDEIMILESNGVTNSVNNFSGKDKNDISKLEEFGIYANKFKVLVRK